MGKVVRAGHKGCVIEILDEIEGSLQPSGYQGFVPASMGPRDWGINFEIRGKHAEETMRRQAEEKASGHKRGRK